MPGGAGFLPSTEGRLAPNKGTFLPNPEAASGKDFVFFWI